MDPATGTPAEFARILAADYAKWGPIVKRSGFTAD
jgi:tripartite-type tricarboxylate transporter receptor subunit TctC